MKKRLLTILCIAAMVMVAGCGKAGNDVAAEVDIKNTSVAPEENQSEEGEEAEALEESTKDPSVDVDLTSLSSTMVYSEVFNMMMEPVAYEGQTVKMDGNCAIYTDEETGNTYYACVVQDATQCCSQGLEFLLDESQYEASDYPAEGAPIVIKGTFSTYEENGGTYITIKDSVLE